MKNKFLSKLMVFAVLICASVVMFACGEKDVNITKIEVNTTTIPETIVVGGFDNAGIKATIYYEDGSSQLIDVTTALIPEEFRSKLDTPGIYEIEILFKNAKAQITVKIVEDINVYTVKFYNAYGLTISSQMVDEGEDAIEPAEELKNINGYSFVEWDVDFTNVTKDLDVYAVCAKVEDVVTQEFMAEKLQTVADSVLTSSWICSEVEEDYHNGELQWTVCANMAQNYDATNNKITVEYYDNDYYAYMDEDQTVHTYYIDHEGCYSYEKITMYEDWTTEQIAEDIAIISSDIISEYFADADKIEYSARFTKNKTLYSCVITEGDTVITIVYDNVKVLSIEEVETNDYIKYVYNAVFSYGDVESVKDVYAGFIATIENEMTNGKTMVNNAIANSLLNDFVAQSTSAESTIWIGDSLRSNAYKSYILTESKYDKDNLAYVTENYEENSNNAIYYAWQTQDNNFAYDVTEEGYSSASTNVFYNVLTVDENDYVTTVIYDYEDSVNYVCFASGRFFLIQDNKIVEAGYKNDETETVSITAFDYTQDVTVTIPENIKNSAILYGDVNGDGIINTQDIRSITQHIENESQLTEAQQVLADVNIDGTIDNVDVFIIRHYITNWIEFLPYETNIVLGDVNLDGALNSKDVLRLMKYLHGEGDPIDLIGSFESLLNADVNQDGQVNYIDGWILFYHHGDWDIEIPYSTNVVVGDVNLDGNVDENDVIALQNYLNDNASLTFDAIINADTNYDNVIDENDITRLQELINVQE